MTHSSMILSTYLTMINYLQLYYYYTQPRYNILTHYTIIRLLYSDLNSLCYVLQQMSSFITRNFDTKYRNHFKIVQHCVFFYIILIGQTIYLLITVFPGIFSSLEQFPPFNSFRGNYSIYKVKNYHNAMIYLYYICIF